MRALVVGAGCTGASAARRLAEAGWQVTVVDRRPHIGGNAYDRRSRDGILYHAYGPHIFFTDRKEVWDFLEPFAKWTRFRCALRVWLEGKSLPMPFQPETLRGLLPEDADAALRAMRERWPERKAVTVLELLEAENPLLQLAGRRLYESDCVPYNRKQWGLSPEALSPEVTARAPVWLEDRREFRPERYQFMPEEGFTALFGSMLNHPSIEVRTGTDALALMRVSDGKLRWTTAERWDAALYTGMLDRLFSGRAGALPYRTLRFDVQQARPEEGLPCLAMYYPGPEVPWTRRTDYRYLPGNPPDKTLLIGERPAPVTAPSDEPYYVVLTEQSKRRSLQYRRLVEQTPHLYAAGRLADYRYYNMDEAVARGLEAADELRRGEGTM